MHNVQAHLRFWQKRQNHFSLHYVIWAWYEASRAPIHGYHKPPVPEALRGIITLVLPGFEMGAKILLLCKDWLPATRQSIKFSTWTILSYHSTTITWRPCRLKFLTCLHLKSRTPACCPITGHTFITCFHWWCTTDVRALNIHLTAALWLQQSLDLWHY